MDVWSQEERYDQKRTCERISKSSTSDKEDQRDMLREGHMPRIMLHAPVPAKRRRGRQTTGWKDSCKRDMESAGLKKEDALDRTKWKNYIHNNSGDPR